MTFKKLLLTILVCAFILIDSLKIQTIQVVKSYINQSKKII